MRKLLLRLFPVPERNIRLRAVVIALDKLGIFLDYLIGKLCRLGIFAGADIRQREIVGNVAVISVVVIRLKAELQRILRRAPVMCIK